MSNPTTVQADAVLAAAAPEAPAATPAPELHPVLADVLKEEEPDTVSWVKG